MASVKVTIDSATLEVFPTGAEATLTAWVDFGVANAGDPKDPRSLGMALTSCGFGLGQIVDVGSVPGCPNMLNVFAGLSLGKKGQQSNQMRVASLRVKDTNNSQKWLVAIILRSRPRPTIQYDSALTQRIVETFLERVGFDGPIGRSQMTLDCQIPAGYYIPGVQPTEAFNLPKVPLSSQVLRFGASLRITSTYYDDELNADIMNQIRSLDDCVNSKGFIFGDTDISLWICSDISISSPDGGYTNLIGADFTYNIDGWDTVGVYTDPFTGQKQLLPPEVVSNLYKPLDNSVTNPPQAYYPPLNSPGPGFVGGGAAKFPQHVWRDFMPVVTALLQNTDLSDVDLI